MTTFRWKWVVRLLAAILLLAVPPSLSKVICVTAAGHEAVEDWAAACCAPGDVFNGASLAAPSPCQGCTDYPLAHALGVKGPQRDTPLAAYYAVPTAAATHASGTALHASTTFPLECRCQFSSAGPPPVTTSLRC